jgi:hypothetical protein
MLPKSVWGSMSSPGIVPEQQLRVLERLFPQAAPATAKQKQADKPGQALGHPPPLYSLTGFEGLCCLTGFEIKPSSCAVESGNSVWAGFSSVPPGSFHAGLGRKKSDVKVIPLARANNVSIMLTQFSSFKRGVQGIRQAVYSGKGLGIEKLGLLLQVNIWTSKSP